MTYELLESIREKENGKSRLRMRDTSVEKKLIEELLPISRYVQAKYRPGRYISVQWVNGSQQYDAIIHQTGVLVEQGFFPAEAHLEVTGAMHPNEYLSRERVEKVGDAFSVEGLSRLKNGQIESQVVVHSNDDFIEEFSHLVVGQILKKAGIAYPTGTILIVSCTLNSTYYPNEWSLLVSKVRAALPSHDFLEIFMYDAISEYASSFY